MAETTDPKNKELLLQRAMNIQTRQLLIEQGCDLAVPRSVHNVFYVPDPETVTLLSDELRPYGFVLIRAEPALEKGESSSDWYVEMDCRVVPDIDHLNEMTDTAVLKSREIGCKYDGWFTQA